MKWLKPIFSSKPLVKIEPWRTYALGEVVYDEGQQKDGLIVWPSMDVDMIAEIIAQDPEVAKRHYFVIDITIEATEV